MSHVARCASEPQRCNPPEVAVTLPPANAANPNTWRRAAKGNAAYSPYPYGRCMLNVRPCAYAKDSASPLMCRIRERMRQGNVPIVPAVNLSPTGSDQSARPLLRSANITSLFSSSRSNGVSLFPSAESHTNNLPLLTPANYLHHESPPLGFQPLPKRLVPYRLICFLTFVILPDSPPTSSPSSFFLLPS